MKPSLSTAAVTLALAALSLAAQTALAESPADVLRAELSPGWTEGQGRHMAGVQLTLAPGWKTYWRAPGDAGIPPSFDWSGSENLRAVRVHWPAPMIFHTNGMQSVGYKGSVTLPVEVVPRDPAAPVRLKLRMDLGVCKDICMPATVDLSSDLAQAPGSGSQAIRAALAARPETSREAGLATIGCEVEPISDGLRLTARMALPPQGGAETVVFEPGLPGVWVSESRSQRQGGILTAVTEMVPPEGQPFALDRSGITVTVISDRGAVEIAGCPAP